MKEIEIMMIEQLQKGIEQVRFWIMEDNKEMVQDCMERWNTNREFVQRITGKKYALKNWKVIEAE